MQPKRVTAGQLPNQPTADGLEQNQDIDGNANSMMRVRQIAGRADGEEAEHEDDGGKANSQDLQVGMVVDGPPRSAGVEPDEEHGAGYNEEEGYRGENTMAEDKTVVLREGRKAVPHA
jgi:hypothetical protein